MNQREVAEQEKRIREFKRLKQLRDDLTEALSAFTKDDPAGPCGQGPFTGNTRESRRVLKLRIYFSATRGGAPAVEKTIPSINMEACEFAAFFTAHLRKQIELASAAIEKL